MLTGPKLGNALREAIRLKGVSNADVARHFGVKGPSVYDWLKHGRIGKQHIERLVAYFEDVVPPEHWGMHSTKADNAALAGGLDPMVELRIVLAITAQALAGSIPAAGRELARALERQPILRHSEFAQNVIDTIHAELAPREAQQAPQQPRQAAGGRKRP